MISGLKHALVLRRSYKAVFTSREGQRVLRHLIKAYVLSNPVVDNRDVMLINIGKQRLALEILSKAHGSDAALIEAIEKEAAEPQPE